MPAWVDCEVGIHGEWPSEGATSRVYSGHESFVCRPGWLPKLHEAISADPRLFESDERAILALGLGRNMVKSLRFWGDAFGLTATSGGETRPTVFARNLLDLEGGLDPYLEELGSLWRLHWHISTRARLGAWVVGLLENADPETERGRLVDMVRLRASTGRKPITEDTAANHVDILLRTYDNARLGERRVLAEDSLGSPMQELELLEVTSRSGRQVVRFRRGHKPGLDAGVLADALHDFWLGTAPASRTLSLRSLLLERRSPGNVFRLDEGSLHRLLEDLVAGATALAIDDDGAGGVNIFATRADAFAQLKELAWRAN